MLTNTATAPTSATIEPSVTQLDHLPLSRFHWKVLLVSGLGWLFDAMDVLIVGSVVAAVAREW
jgi:putative MFS transporter